MLRFLYSGLDKHKGKKMKMLIFFLIFCGSFATYAQFPAKLSPEILILTSHGRHVSRIRKEMKIGCVRDADHQYIEGRVERISTDTIFIQKTFVLMQDLLIVVNPAFAGRKEMAEPEKYRGMGVIYRNDPANYVVYFPPDSLYSSRREYDKAVKNLQNKIKSASGKEEFLPVRNNYLFFNLTRIMALDLAATYEHKLSKTMALSLEGGYKFGVGGSGFMEVYYPWAQGGPSLIIGPKFYHRDKFYIAPLLHLKYLEIHDAYYTIPFSGNTPYFMDQFGTESGVICRFGILVHKGSAWLDFYLGAGLKYVAVYQIDYYSTSEYSQQYYKAFGIAESHNDYGWYPILNLGIKIGLGF
jgi:hypothetical protein